MKRLLIVLLVAALSGLFVGQAQGAPGAIFTCSFSGQLDRIDPIVSPGVYPTAHFHRFAGAGPVTPTSNSASLRQQATSCVEAGNHSAYWTISPVQNGVHLGPSTTKHFLAYYRCRHSASVCASMQSFPEDFGQVVGNANAANASENPVFANGLGGFRCGTGGGTFYPTMPATCSSTLVGSVTFGNCRYPDGSTSMATNSNCTGAGGGVPMPRIQMYWRFAPRDSNTSNVTLDGHPPYQWHADVLFAWNAGTFEAFLNQCIRANVDCGTNPPLPDN